ncbi:hypothetical protein [Enterococcus malodoratus]|nr:hypothetical protein [Enterococcus malodoratus]
MKRKGSGIIVGLVVIALAIGAYLMTTYNSLICSVNGSVCTRKY